MGPWAGPCRGGLDFTLLFEESIFSILPSALLFLAAPIQLIWVRGKTKTTRGGPLLPSKLALIIIMGLLKLSLVLLWALQSPQEKTRTTLPASVLNFLVIGPLFVFSCTEHVFRIRPSVVIQIFLLLTTIFDVARIRTLWLMPGAMAFAATECGALAVKIGLVIAEAWPKHKLVVDDLQLYSGEQLSGFYSKTLFLWLMKTLWNGTIPPIPDPADLAGPQNEETAERRRTTFRTHWARRPDKQGKTALFATLVKAMPGHFLLPFVPRVIIVGVTLTQPMLLRRMLEFVQEDPETKDINVGYTLIGAFALVYGLAAVFNGWFHHACNKLALELRSQLVDATYNHLLRLRLSALDTGKATTLINVDMQHIMDGSLILHDIWASVLTLAIATYMLYKQIQLAFIAPLLCTLVLTIVGGAFGGPLGNRQVAWLASTESRVKSTMNMISSFKEVKMLGLAPAYFKSLKKLRFDEVQLGRKFRRVVSVLITLSAASTQVSILVAYGGFAIISKLHGVPLTTETLFASLALLRISLDPLFLLIQGTPHLVSLFKCLGRIQDLLNDERRLTESYQDPAVGSGIYSMSSKTLTASSADSSPDPNNPYPLYLNHVSHLGFGDFRPPRTSVGSGKSTLLKSLLGELEQVSGVRVIQPNLKIAYCDQEPWLLDQTVQKNITGDLEYDPEWYSTVVEACALQQDIAQFGRGSETRVGSGGSAMSGGQRAELPSPVPGLDRKSTQHIFSSLFSHSGLLNTIHCAVVLTTHSTQLLPRFETIVVLDNGKVTHQDGYYELLAEGVLNEDALSSAQEAAGDGPVEGRLAADIESKPYLAEDEDAMKNQAPSDSSVYKYFFKACGSAGMALFFVLAAVLAAERSFENVWLKMWAESTEDSLTYYICVFTGLIMGGLVLLYGICFFFFDVLLVSSSLKLYFGQLETLIQSPISYVVTVGSTTIANRFIQDIMLVDDELPMALVNVTTAFFGAFAESIIIFISSKYVSVSVPLLLLVLWVIQRFYLRTSKQLRLMDIEAKAPLSAFMLETIKGIASIRAFGRSTEFTRRNRGHLEDSQKALFMLLSVQVWLKMVLDFVVCFLAILVTTLAVVFQSSQSPGFLGLALVNLISLSSSFKYLITFWANLESSIGAVGRIKRFNEEAKPEEPMQLPEPYPSPKLPLALENVNLSIDPGSKVAICGRSGSGKSSLLGTLLRCLDLTSGSIVIDGQDITRIDRDALRGRIMTLPQKSLFIDDSIRQNMLLWEEDPSLTSDEVDRRIEAALRRVGLWDVLFERKPISASSSEAPMSSRTSLKSSSSATACPTEDGKSKDEKKSDKSEEKEKKIEEVVSLDSSLDAEERLSIGQQQLFCLARALFQRSESHIEIIKRDLKGKTVIEVIHRLEHIMEFDTVVVVDRGRVVEIGNPGELLQMSDGYLRELYQTSNM
ncbi:unnamed protein product [Parascedosporium putredinis]|uniref:ABC transporter n=1 Tax=Parascedosporium putredinis TaxID=1442378 RepID=A0A9P1M7C6_9PEZI|nr:unnamed protein product [Parascedosporium putredinis]CAI7990216.1 unnamed protein product [Parascedosporium putredinis]